MIIIWSEAIMSRKYTYQCYFNALEQVRQRYHNRDKTKYDFKTDIEPFLKNYVDIVEDIENVELDMRFKQNTKDKVIAIFTESLMNCHSQRMSKKIFEEEIKFINYWLHYIEEQGL